MAGDTEHEQTNLHNAAGMGDIRRVRELLEDVDTDVNEQNCDGQTPLHTAVYYRSHGYVCLPDISVCRILISNRADVNQQDNRGNTPLHLLSGVHTDTLLNIDMDIKPAIDYEDVYSELVTLLIAKGADVNIRNNRGTTALTGWMRNLEGNGRLVENGARQRNWFTCLAVLLVFALLATSVLLRIHFPPEQLRWV